MIGLEIVLVASLSWRHVCNMYTKQAFILLYLHIDFVLLCIYYVINTYILTKYTLTLVCVCVHTCIYMHTSTHILIPYAHFLRVPSLMKKKIFGSNKIRVPHGLAHFAGIMQFQCSFLHHLL
jgi:hypothetical protein